MKKDQEKYQLLIIHFFYMTGLRIGAENQMDRLK
jgi:hypothetical protein